MFVAKAVERVIGNMNAVGVMLVEFDNLDYGDKVELFDFEDMEYSVGIKVYKGVLERLKIKKDFNELYDEFGKMYEAGVVEKGYERKKGDEWMDR